MDSRKLSLNANVWFLLRYCRWATCGYVSLSSMITVSFNKAIAMSAIAGIICTTAHIQKKLDPKFFSSIDMLLQGMLTEKRTMTARTRHRAADAQAHRQNANNSWQAKCQPTPGPARREQNYKNNLNMH